MAKKLFQKLCSSKQNCTDLMRGIELKLGVCEKERAKEAAGSEGGGDDVATFNQCGKIDLSSLKIDGSKGVANGRERESSIDKIKEQMEQLSKESITEHVDQNNPQSW